MPGPKSTPQKPGRGAAILMAVACFAGGAAVVAAAAGILPTQPGAMQAPRWVVACAGAIFMAGAFVPLNATFGLPDWVNRLVALTVGLGLATVFNWIAFFPGERHFTSTISIPGAQLSAPSSELTGRIVFGCGALFCDAIVLYAVWQAVRQGRTPQARGAGASKAS